MKTLDLFSGIGGFSLGLHEAGFETVAFSEIDQFCDQVLKKHWPMIPNLGDITKLSGEKIYERFGKIECICGGFPCQSVSIAGRKAGFEDRKKSGLWYEYKRLIEEIKPRWVIIENVRNLLNIGFAEVIKDLCDLGYDAEWEVISARSVGAKHLRERVWIVAYPTSERGRGDTRGICPKSTKAIGKKQREEFERCGQRTMAYPQRVGFSRQRKLDERLRTEKSTNRKASDVVAGCLGSTDIELPNSNLPRLWPTFTTTEEAQRWWAEATACIGAKWEARPSFRGVVDGLSSRMERYRRERVKALGNSIVPQIAYLIGKRILEVENNLKGQQNEQAS